MILSTACMFKQWVWEKMINSQKLGVHLLNSLIFFVIFSQGSWMTDAGQEKGKSMDHTRDIQATWR